MKALFDKGNPGLARRFPENMSRFTFSPYTRAELRRIFCDDARERGMAVDFACADRAGTITAILVENGAPVEYDQPLFVIE